MIDRTDHLRSARCESFLQARSRLVEARRQLREKDTPDRRAVVAARLVEIDAVLDAHLEAERRSAGPTGRSIDAVSSRGPGLDGVVVLS
jgi:hypothetical protein